VSPTLAKTPSSTTDSYLYVDLGVGVESRALWQQWTNALLHSSKPVSRQPLAEKFAELEETWRAETAFCSSTDALVTHPSYNAVIALGYEVVPLILRSLRTTPAHWFTALVTLTGTDPVPPQLKGNVPAMTATWLAWGKQQGLI
jgi:hypothetical protein